MAVKLSHKGLAEAHDLGVGLPARVKVRAALAAADRHPGQGVLEDLFEAEELNNSQVNTGVEAQAALVRAQGRVELDTETAVDADMALVIDPRHTEDDLALGLADALENRGLTELRVLAQYRFEGFEDFNHRLVEFCFAWIAAEDFVAHACECCVHVLLLIDAPTRLLR